MIYVRRQELFSYCHRQRRTCLEVLRDFPLTTPHVPAAFLFDLFPAIRPRAFSIASAPSAHEARVQILVAVVRWEPMTLARQLTFCLIC
jgi:sulfite reductase alpha subunit-like flavoprotein